MVATFCPFPARPSLRPHAGPAASRRSRAPPPREDAALQNRVGVPRRLARRSLGPRAPSRGLRRRGVPRVSHVRAALLRIRPRSLHAVPAEVCRGIFVQATGRVPILQRPAHGADGGTSRRPRPSAGARAAVGDFPAEAAAGSARALSPTQASRSKRARSAFSHSQAAAAPRGP